MSIIIGKTEKQKQTGEGKQKHMQEPSKNEETHVMVVTVQPFSHDRVYWRDFLKGSRLTISI